MNAIESTKSQTFTASDGSVWVISPDKKTGYFKARSKNEAWEHSRMSGVSVEAIKTGIETIIAVS